MDEQLVPFAIALHRVDGCICASGFGVDFSTRCSAPADERIDVDIHADGRHALSPDSALAVFDGLQEVRVGGVEGVTVFHGLLRLEPLGLFEKGDANALHPGR